MIPKIVFFFVDIEGGIESGRTKFYRWRRRRRRRRRREGNKEGSKKEILKQTVSLQFFDFIAAFFYKRKKLRKFLLSFPLISSKSGLLVGSRFFFFVYVVLVVVGISSLFHMASFSALCPKSSTALALSGSPLQPLNHQQQQSKLSFPLSSSSSKSKGSLISGSSSLDQPAFSRFQGSTRNKSTIWKVQAQLNDVAAEKSSNSIPVPEVKLDVPSLEAKDSSVQNGVLDESSISEFMSQVADLVKLVDSRDIVELKLKQLDCEIIIRKQEALPQAAAPPVMMMQQPPPQTMMPSQAPPAPANSPPASPAPAPKALPAPASKSSAPSLKSPMAGTFYRCPGPGEPAFVKVGDKVKKGQVVCIIEAMKLMNEIEADQSGTIVEIIPEDGKPISFGAPILVIQK